MSYVPKNVRDTAAKNDHYAKLEREQAQETRNSIIAHWSERDRRREPVNTLRGATMTLQATSKEREAGIKAGQATVKAARQARLKELYERAHECGFHTPNHSNPDGVPPFPSSDTSPEALMYERELNERGLSLVKPRD
ncbi:hypothetical protein VOLCADRAFT_106566 [Volvox carteri f. nagariensis]|uniref:Uncharacterized protein n=1 Tax=Volvox carteri f. nagariensis TaxID=3068 RepID=D8U880_VOLCA|nr:uncharacterized protein VOLCADRAFT_106566 [Volvox carteri f. nagariensis]EFJ44043.1 hypothetical protein VOLCADRAFT_106566 [Volvox carteri f. nagariensis]|eukprot:XP_002954844.1 hypothetical protein VOLCADRAFT_106566 [Volvox carteri f. nagariensis]